MIAKVEEVDKPVTIIQTRIYELHPNKVMKQVLDDACDYRRYCFNRGLALWNEMYEARQIAKTTKQKALLNAYPSPTERKVRDELVANKADWQYQYSAHLLQLAITDLANAWSNFFQ